MLLTYGVDYDGSLNDSTLFDHPLELELIGHCYWSFKFFSRLPVSKANTDKTETLNLI